MYGKFFDSSHHTLTDEGVKAGSKLAGEGSILLLVRGSMLFNTIPVGIAKKNVAFNQDVKSITSSEIDRDYLYYFFKASEHKLLSQVVRTGIGAGKLDTEQLQSLKITLPRKPEQEKIAEFLTAVDERIAASEKKLELLQEYKKGVMQKIFTRAVRFKDINGNAYPEWEEKQLREVVEFIQNGLSTDQNSTRVGYKVTRIETISSNVINVNKVGYIQTDSDIAHYKLQQGDLLFSNINSPARIGRTVYVDKDYDVYHGMNLLRIRVNERSDAKYIYYVLSSARYKQWFERICNKAVNQASINQTDLGKTKLNMPSFNEQQKITTFLTVLDDKIKAEQARLTAAKQWKKGLLQRMFV